MRDQHTDYSLIILTFNRPAFLKRLLTFISEYPHFGTILVADASEPTFKEANRAIVDSFADSLHIRLHELPSDFSIIDTLEAAAAEVTTEFVSYCPDDDFVHPDLIIEAVEFLKSHEDYTLCGGRYSLVSMADERVVFTLQSNDSCEYETPLERITHLIRNYWPTQFAVQRRYAFLDGIRAFKSGAIETAIGEILHGSIIALHGKLKVLDHIGISHDISPHPRQSASDSAYSTLFTERGIDTVCGRFISEVEKRMVATPDFDRDATYVALGSALVDHLAGHAFIFSNAARQIVREDSRPDINSAQRQAIRSSARLCLLEIAKTTRKMSHTGACAQLDVNLTDSNITFPPRELAADRASHRGHEHRIFPNFLRRFRDLQPTGNMHLARAERWVQRISLLILAMTRAQRALRHQGLRYTAHRVRRVLQDVRTYGFRCAIQQLLDTGRAVDTFASYRATVLICHSDGSITLPAFKLPAVKGYQAPIPHPPLEKTLSQADSLTGCWRGILIEQPFLERYREQHEKFFKNSMTLRQNESNLKFRRLFDAYFTQNLADELSHLYFPIFEPAESIIRRLDIQRFSSFQRKRLERIADLMYEMSALEPATNSKLTESNLRNRNHSRQNAF